MTEVTEPQKQQLCKDCKHHHWQSPWTGQGAHACWHHSNVKYHDPVEGLPVLRAQHCITLRLLNDSLINLNTCLYHERVAAAKIEMLVPSVPNLSKLKAAAENL